MELRLIFYTVTQQLIDDLYEDNIITLESERIERYDKGEDEVQEPEREKKRIFQKQVFSSFRKGFLQNVSVDR